MTRERLEELIKQKGIVYCPMNLNGFIVEYDLSVFRCQIASDDEKVFACIFNADYEGGCYHLRDVFETREQALWSAKIRANRIEIFDPPMWDDIDTQYEFNFFDRHFIRPGIYCVRHMRFSVYNGDKDKEVYLYDETSREYEIYEQHATKEHYEKACEIVRELFNKRGEK